MHLGSAVHQIITFLGFPDAASPGGIRCEGTGFFLRYKTGAYLITARHVAKTLDGSPFVIRLNRTGGKAELLELANRGWHYHDDPTVDLATVPIIIFQESGYDVQYFTEDMLVTREVIERHQIDVGDECHTVGLFKFLYGNQRSFPLVHAGSISLMPPPGERIPVWNNGAKQTELVEGVLIQSHALDGASGSPVLVRASFALESPVIQDEHGERRRPMFFEQRVRLFGLFQGAWFLPPDATLAKGINAGPSDIVPVGVGIMVPCYKIVEMLDQGPLVALRNDENPPVWAAQQLSTLPMPSPMR